MQEINQTYDIAASVPSAALVLLFSLLAERTKGTNSVIEPSSPEHSVVAMAFKARKALRTTGASL